jgi:hypothetical protein
VNAKISMGQLENGGFGLAGELSVNVPRFSRISTKLVDKASSMPLLERNSGNIEIKLIN